MRSQFHGCACYYCSANVRIIIYFDEVISHFAIRHLGGGGGAVPPKYLQLIHSKILFPGTLNILGLKKGLVVSAQIISNSCQNICISVHNYP